MKHCLVTAAAIGGLVASTAGWSKGDITKITVEHLVTHVVIEITDPEELDRFTIWSGPGVVSWDMVKTVPQAGDPAFFTGGYMYRPTSRRLSFADREFEYPIGLKAREAPTGDMPWTSG